MWKEPEAQVRQGIIWTLGLGLSFTLEDLFRTVVISSGRVEFETVSHFICLPWHLHSAKATSYTETFSNMSGGSPTPWQQWP